MTKKTKKPPAGKAPTWLRGGVRALLPEIKPGESDDAPDGMPAESCTVQSVHEEHGVVVVMIDGSLEPTKVAIEDLEEHSNVVAFPGPTLPEAEAAQVQAELAGQAPHVDPEPTVPPGPAAGVRAGQAERLEQQVRAAEAAAKRATAKFLNLSRRLSELKGGA